MVEKKLVKLCGKLNSENYISFLQSNLLPDYVDREIFQRDQVPCHISRATAIKKILLFEDFQLLKDWPIQSTDLNIIALLRWKLKKQSLQRKSTKSPSVCDYCQELENILNEKI